MRQTKAKDSILNTAARLFYKQGYANTGINQIVGESGIAKSTLYQHFKSKEDLLIAYLNETGETTIAALEEAAQQEQAPKEKIIAIFDYLEQLAIEPEFYGCHFLNLVYEMPDGEERARLAIQEQKNAVRALFADILQPINKQELADEFYTLFEGALIGQKVHKDVWPVLAAKNIALKLL